MPEFVYMYGWYEITGSGGIDGDIGAHLTAEDCIVASGNSTLWIKQDVGEEDECFVYMIEGLTNLQTIERVKIHGL